MLTGLRPTPYGVHGKKVYPTGSFTEICETMTAFLSASVMIRSACACVLSIQSRSAVSRQLDMSHHDSRILCMPCVRLSRYDSVTSLACHSAPDVAMRGDY